MPRKGEAPVHVTRAKIAAALLALLKDRGASTTCPSEVARLIDPAGWRALMRPVREAAAA